MDVRGVVRVLEQSQESWGEEHAFVVGVGCDQEDPAWFGCRRRFRDERGGMVVLSGPKQEKNGEKEEPEDETGRTTHDKEGFKLQAFKISSLERLNVEGTWVYR